MKAEEEEDAEKQVATTLAQQESSTSTVTRRSSSAETLPPPPVVIVSAAAAAGTENDKEAGVFITLYVNHAGLVTLLHVAFCIVCCVFAFPYFDLSRPDAGLRLRQDPYADRGDGFYAANAVMLPDGFGAGIQGQSVQKVFDERTQPGNGLFLYWYMTSTLDQGNVLSPGAITQMQSVESAVFNLPTYQQLLCLREGSDSNKCVGPTTPTTINSSSPTSISELFAQNKFFFPASTPSNVNASSVIAYTRTEFYIGFPLADYLSPADRVEEQQQRVYEILQREVLPLLRRTMDSSQDGQVKLVYFHDQTRAEESIAILMQDLTYAGMAAATVFVSLCFHFNSLVLGLGAILQVMVSFPVTLFFYRLVLNIDLFGGLHVIAIFLILGIGVDDCFVLFDAYDQVTRLHPTLPLASRLRHSYHSAAYTTFTTTLTTFLCFLSLVTCSIPVLKWFGVFCSLLVFINYVLCITLFVGLICLYDQHVRRSNKPRAVATFGERMLVWVVAKSLMKHPWRRNLVLLLSLAFILAMTLFAAELAPSKSIDSFYPVGHPFRIHEEIVSTGFYGDKDRFATVAFVNGLKSPFREGYRFARDDDFGHAVFDPEFHMADPAVQQYLVDQCDRIQSQLANNTELHSTQITNCPMSDFKFWLESKSAEFPVANQTAFEHRLLEFYLQPGNPAKIQIGFERNNNSSAPFRPRYYFNYFATSRSRRMESHEDRVRLWDAWEAFSAKPGEAPKALGADGSTHAVDGYYEVWMESQKVMLYNCVTSISFSIGVAFAVLLLGSGGDIMVAVSGTFTMASSVCSTLGTMYLLGWSLGAVEAVSATILCGIAVDYNIHLSISFAESTGATKYERVETAMGKIGVSVLYGGTTTFLASSFLLLCTTTVLSKFGQFMMMVVSYSLVFSFFTQMALLSIELPSRAFLRSVTRGWQVRVPYSCWRGAYLVFLVAWIAAVVAIGLTFHPPSTIVVAAELAALPTASFENATLKELDADGGGRWTLVTVPLNGTGCAKVGSPYSFFIYTNPNVTNKGAVVEFEGRANAVCSSLDTCSAPSGVFSTSIDLQRFQRINAKVERFPFVLAQESRVHVYLPYCTGDAFLGNGVVTYSDLVAMQHVGQANAQAALQFVQRVASDLAGGKNRLVLQGCGVGAIGALAHSIGLTANASVIADSMALLEPYQLFARTVWKSTLPDFTYASLNATLGKARLLAVTSAYDWFQSAVYASPSLNGGNRSKLQFKFMVENNQDAFSHLVRVKGDRHCQVLNPVGDGMGVDPKLRPLVEQLFGPSLLVKDNDYYAKCASPGECEVDADLR
ncbi:hypothetical protein BASA81_012713 [Batrachochytrium salamandrivorans]|nr:hypothetical protein BASA81_012713 [Batrachochytrium salamandrivorans]